MKAPANAKRSLPVVQSPARAKPAKPAPVLRYTATRAAHRACIAAAKTGVYLYLSGNSKTGVSVNFPVHATCRPTAACARYCYALSGLLQFLQSVNRQGENFKLCQELETASDSRVAEVAAVLLSDLRRAGASFVRWNGSGDLTPGAVRVINALATLAPTLAQWIITRKPDVAAALADHPAIRVQFTLDGTTLPGDAARMGECAARFKLAAATFAYVRTSESDTAPSVAAVIFNEHTSNKRNAWADARACHATLPGNSHENSCDGCRRCFAPRDGAHV